ncbi:hypothetical protein BGW41_000170 [Actinomortierella wolfii]|nr:hypothetical protein BGW41_000170 [Actinomortierella wolfii]
MTSPPTGKDKGKEKHSPSAGHKTRQGIEEQAVADPSTDPSAAAPSILHRHHSESEPATQPLPETSTSDIGLLRLSGQVSQNESRLKHVALLSTTITDSQTLENIPSIGTSPGMAMAPPGSSLEQSTPNRSREYSEHDSHQTEGDSHPLDVLSYEDLSHSHSTTHEESILHEVVHEVTQEVTEVANTSFSPANRSTSFSSHHSIEFNTTNNSIQSQASSGSGSSRGNRSQTSQGSRSSGSQSHSSGSQPESTVSTLSFRGATTSTPRQTPQPRNYLSSQSTPSDNERRASLESSHSQISPPTGGSAPTPVWNTSLSPDSQPFKSSSYPGAQGKKGRDMSSHIQTGVMLTVSRETGHHVATTTTATTVTAITATSTSGDLDAPTQPVDEFGPIAEIPGDIDHSEKDEDIVGKTEPELAGEQVVSTVAKGKARAQTEGKAGVAPPPAGSSGATSKEHELKTITEEDEVEPGVVESGRVQRRSSDNDPVAAAGPSSRPGSPKRRVHRRSDSGSSHTGSSKSSSGGVKEKTKKFRRTETGEIVEYLTSEDDDEAFKGDSINLNLTASFRGMESYASDATSRSRSRPSSLPSSDTGHPPRQIRRAVSVEVEEEETPVVYGTQLSDRESPLGSSMGAPNVLVSEGSVVDISSQPELMHAQDLLGSSGTQGSSTGARPQVPQRSRSGYSHSSRSARSSLSLDGGELPSSQASSSSAATHDSAFIQRLKNAAEDDDDDNTVHKRRRRLPSESGDMHVMSSIGDEDGWDGSDRGDRRGSSIATLTRTVSGSSSSIRSRAGGRSPPSSQNLASYPDDSLSVEDEEKEVEIVEEVGPSASLYVGDMDQPSEPRTPTRRSTRSSARLLALAESGGSGGSGASQKSRVSPRSPRSKRAPSTPSTPSKRGGNHRRVQKAGDVLRTYKADDAVWAKYNRGYFPGVVKNHVSGQDKYEVHFLDEYRGTCAGSHLRPLKLTLGVEVMARKDDRIEEPATVEGFEIHPEDLREASHVDVRFEDDTEMNLDLWKISLTQEMMEEMDRKINWDQDYPMVVPKTMRAPGGAAAGSDGDNSAGPSSLAHGPSDLTASPYVTRSSRSQSLHSDPIVPMTPSRRSRVAEKLGGQIKAAGGYVMEDFTELASRQREVPENLFLVTTAARRTKKYIEALALGIPRVAVGWLEKCLEERRVFPHQSYLLPTGFSRELGTIVSSVAENPKGVFHGYKIGLCGTKDFWSRWHYTLFAAGAEVVDVNSNTEKGVKECHFIVFGSQLAFEKFFASHPDVKPLSIEWVIQCLVNQRILSVEGHPSYTAFDISNFKIPK